MFVSEMSNIVPLYLIPDVDIEIIRLTVGRVPSLCRIKGVRDSLQTSPFNGIEIIMSEEKCKLPLTTDVTVEYLSSMRRIVISSERRIS